MIKTLTAHTYELDNEDQAVSDILSGLESGGELLRNSIGIVACHYEFVHSGVYKKVSDALPFDVVGTISSAQMIPGESGSLLLTLMVLTSDDVEFDKVITSPLSGDPAAAIAEGYNSIRRAEKPALILMFAPFILANCGDDYVNVITKASGGVPCFGTIAVDDTLDFANCFMLSDGESHRERMAMVLIYGAISPKFYIANISESKIINNKGAFVTKSAGPVLMEVNERPLMDFFAELGLVEAAEIQYAMSTLPFLLDYNDGTPKVSKIFVMLSPEKYAICAGAIPQGSTLYVASSDKETVLGTTGEAIGAILRDIKGSSGLLIYSCISRAMTLGSEQFMEMELIDRDLGGKLPLMMVNSGGEICPTQVSGGTAINRFQNNAFVACLF